MSVISIASMLIHLKFQTKDALNFKLNASHLSSLAKIRIKTQAHDTLFKHYANYRMNGTNYLTIL